MASNYFKDLGLNLDATANDVRDAYKKLAKQWHPDKNKEEGAEEKFKNVLAAYTYLQSEDRRDTHAREIRRRQEAAAAPKPSPQPPPPTQSTTPHRNSSSKPSEPQATNSSNPNPKTKKPKEGSSQGQKNWWESFKSNSASQTKQPTTNQTKSNNKRNKTQRKAFFMDSFFELNDPFDDFVFSIFMIPPERPSPKTKKKTDCFGNPLPKNIENDIYDWKSATKSAGQMPDYQEYIDGETEFSCNWCGLMMDMDMLRKHEPRCQRLGGKRVNSGYQFNDEEV
ncbi:uncharacterized protein, partial [Watersipora subatra]|uniref:uncharacterized protein n=1 Tax=Watersipora subatra TaxID=2589382 RepID=UPI00355C5A81